METGSFAAVQRPWEISFETLCLMGIFCAYAIGEINLRVIGELFSKLSETLKWTPASKNKTLIQFFSFYVISKKSFFKSKMAAMD